MHSRRYSIMQYLLATATMFAILVGTGLASGVKLAHDAWMSLAYALAMAAIFISARYSQSRKR